MPHKQWSGTAVTCLSHTHRSKPQSTRPIREAIQYSRHSGVRMCIWMLSY